MKKNSAASSLLRDIGYVVVGIALFALGASVPLPSIVRLGLMLAGALIIALVVAIHSI